MLREAALRGPPSPTPALWLLSARAFPEHELWGDRAAEAGKAWAKRPGRGHRSRAPVHRCRKSKHPCLRKCPANCESLGIRDLACCVSVPPGPQCRAERRGETQRATLSTLFEIRVMNTRQFAFSVPQSIPGPVLLCPYL